MFKLLDYISFIPMLRILYFLCLVKPIGTGTIVDDTSLKNVERNISKAKLLPNSHELLIYISNSK